MIVFANADIVWKQIFKLIILKTMEFKTQINNENISIHDPKKKLINGCDVIYDLKGLVYWTLDIDIRDWGIKDVALIVKKVEIEGDSQYYKESDQDYDDPQYQDIQFTNDKFTIVDDDLKFTENFCCPTDIVVDFETKTITIS